MLDLLRQVAATSRPRQRRHRQPLIFTGDGGGDVAFSGGNFHAEPVAFAADVLALAICEIGSLAERRVAMLIDPALSRLPAFLTPKPGLNSGFMIPQVTAAALVSEASNGHPGQCRQHPDVGESGGSCLDGRPWRAPAVADDPQRPGDHRDRAVRRRPGVRFSSAAAVDEILEEVRFSCTPEIPYMEDDRCIAPGYQLRNQAVLEGAIPRPAHGILPEVAG